MVEPAPTKRSSAAKVVLTLLFGFVLLAVIGIGTCTVVLLQSPKTRKMVSGLPAIMKEGVAATLAPGAEELRDAGCEEAGVMDTAAIQRLVESIEAAQDKGERRPVAPMPPTIVFCQFSFGTPDLDCDDVARVYVGAVERPPTEFAVTVRVKVPRRDVCQGIYDGEARFVRPLDDDESAAR